jgi:formylglycine-generating enzyme required for sulfatase activity
MLRRWLSPLTLAAVALSSIVAERDDTGRDPGTLDVRVPGTTAVLEFLRLPAERGGEPELWLARTELPWDAYDAWFMGLDVEPAERPRIDASSRPSKPYGAVDRGFGHDGYPAIGMTAEAAERFATWLSEQTGGLFRLPSEAEWERAARHALTDELEACAWVFENANDTTHPVGTKAPSLHGFHDLLGNAGEWCTTADGGHALRGGSYYDFADEVSPQTRFTYEPSWQRRDPQIPKSSWWLSDGPFVGMRLICASPPPEDPSATDSPDSPSEQ